MFYLGNEARGMVVLATITAFTQPMVADLKTDVGYTQLLAELGAAAIPKGAGVTVSQVEASTTSSPNFIYLPNSSLAQFAGKTFTDKSGLSNALSSHANDVGSNLYGSSSIAPGITSINNWLAGNWLQTGFLKTGAGAAPAIETQDIQNHSWIGEFTTEDATINALQRLDYAINRDDFVSVVGVNNPNNSTTTTLSKLLAQSYNSISVGLTSGLHTHGFTTLDSAGRIKPEIVVPHSFTSFATPVVGAAAAMLLEKAKNTPALTEATHSESIKAILLAGATKSEFPAWDRTTTRPLDDVFGAGELNIFNSYHILTAGAFNPGAVGATGWDFDATSAGGDTYFITIPNQYLISELSVILTWNRLISDAAIFGFGPQMDLPDLDLKLFQADGMVLGSLIDQSISTVDNVEHIYWNSILPGQIYALQVTSPVSNIDFSLAWRSTLVPNPNPIPEPGSLAILIASIGISRTSRRRRRKSIH